jgi:hypothetical protein
MDSLTFRFQLRSLFTDRIIVDEILIDGPEITYELGLGNSNIGRILENVESVTGTEEKPAQEPPPAQGGKKVQINRLLITNAHVRISAKLMLGVAAPIPLPTIDMRDIGKEKEGRTFGQVVADVFRAIGRGTLGAVTGTGKLIGKGAGAVGHATAKGAKSVVGGIKNLFADSPSADTNNAADGAADTNAVVHP